MVANPSQSTPRTISSPKANSHDSNILVAPGDYQGLAITAGAEVKVLMAGGPVVGRYRNPIPNRT